MNEKELVSVLKENDRNTIERVCAILNEHKITIRDNLADFVAALCDVDKDKMMNISGRGDAHLSYARWFYWYTSRMLLGSTYKEMSENHARIGARVTQHGIMQGVARMATMTEEEPIWRKRWIIMKRIIEESKKNPPIKIVVPKEVEIEIEKK